jgi:hypothetical protein
MLIFFSPLSRLQFKSSLAAGCNSAPFLDTLFADKTDLVVCNVKMQVST